MIKYTPNTQTINNDRNYFIEKNNFIKIDDNIERGSNEARILSILKDNSLFCQEYVNSYIENNKHVLITKYFRSETLENAILDINMLKKIEQQLFSFFIDMQKLGIVHGDLNVSNILFDGKKIKIIDWETSYAGDSILDLFGPPTVTNHCGILNVIQILRRRTYEI